MKSSHRRRNQAFSDDVLFLQFCLTKATMTNHLHNYLLRAASLLITVRIVEKKDLFPSVWQTQPHSIFFNFSVNTGEMFHLLRLGFRKMAHMQECQSRGAEDWRWAATGNWKREKRSRSLVRSVETHFPDSDVSVEYILQSRSEGWGNSQK